MPPKTPTAVYETIVQWLNEKDNFLLITGSAGFKTAVVSGKKLKKKDAYEKLRIHVNQKHGTEYTDKQIKNKYDWLLTKFKEAKEKVQGDEDAEKLEVYR